MLNESARVKWLEALNSRSLLRARRERGEESPLTKYPSALWREERERCMRRERVFSSLWTVSMVIAVSWYVLFNLCALERSHVMFIRIFFFSQDFHILRLCETELRRIAPLISFSSLCFDTICNSRTQPDGNVIAPN